jgi:hypothetical protein
MNGGPSPVFRWTGDCAYLSTPGAGFKSKRLGNPPGTQFGVEKEE